jgi:hypothetical protein
MTNGRGPDPIFLSTEALYYRVRSIQGDRVSPMDISFTPSNDKSGISVNRGKYSEPHHLLFHKYPKCLTYGVARFVVGDIPPELEHPETHQTLTFRVEHAPLEDNYSHSEIRGFEGTNRKRPLQEWFKKTIRQRLSDRMVVVILPDLARTKIEPSGVS